MKPRFLGDANLHGDIIAGLVRRERSIDFEIADNLGLRGIGDPKVLKIASDADRILVTHDCRTMPAHFAVFLQKHQSPGVIMINQTINLGTAIDGMIYVWNEFDHEDWINRIAYLNQIKRL